jgi:hypothetical protein
MPSEFTLWGFFMILYTATNTKTGRFYIGSAASVKHYIARRRYHLTVNNSKWEFHRDLQENPADWVWETSEITDRSEEEAMLALYVGSKYCYNKSSRADGSGFGGRPKGYEHKISTREKQSDSQRQNWEDNEGRKALVRDQMKKTNSKKQPCPQCGMLMNVGNLTKHLKGTRCKGKQQ